MEVSTAGEHSIDTFIVSHLHVCLKATNQTQTWQEKPQQELQRVKRATMTFDKHCRHVTNGQGGSDRV